MRQLFSILLFLGFFVPAYGQEKSEAALIAHILQVIQKKEPASYIHLFPGIDSLSQWIMQHADANSPAVLRVLAAQQDAGTQLSFDSVIHQEAKLNFESFLKKAKSANVHWDKSVFVRYELEKVRRGRGLVNEKIAPFRFLGFVFIKDLLSRKTFAFTVNDLMQVNGLWYGGELSNIYEAATKEEFREKLAEDRKRQRKKDMGMAADKTANGVQQSEDDADKDISMKEVVDRKFYRGYFDDDIPVQLYIRYNKGACPQASCSWDALFRFGDQDEWVRMFVSMLPNGNWLFTEEVGGMELSLEDNVYSGSWASDRDKTEYEVELKEAEISTQKIERLDTMLEQGEYVE